TGRARSRRAPARPQPGGVAQGVHHRTLRRPGNSLRPRRSGLLSRGSRPSPGGQRQRGDEEGQTFTKDVGKEVLPEFLSVADDPTITKFRGTWLSGSYEYDDEGQKAERVDLIQDGVLKTFLMSRLPIASFGASNGHGRAESGHIPTGRQGNLIV